MQLDGGLKTTKKQIFNYTPLQLWQQSYNNNMNASTKKHRNLLHRESSAKQYFQLRLPFIKSNLPAQQSFTTVFHKRRPNLIKMKELHSLKQKQERMNYTILKNYTEQEKKMKRYGNVNQSYEQPRKEKEKSVSKSKIRNFFYHAMQSRLAESRRYFSLDK